MTKFISMLALAIASMLATNARAAGYVEVAGGQGYTDINCQGPTCSPTSSSFKLVGGAALTGHIAVEGGYIHFGTSTTSGVMKGFNYSADATAGALVLAGVYRTTPMEGWTFDTRLGVARTKAEMLATTSKGNYTGSMEMAGTKSQPYLGVSVNYAIAKNWQLGFSGDYTKAEVQGFTYYLRAFNVGLRYDL